MTDQYNLMLASRGRVQAVQLLGFETVSIIRIGDLSDAEKRAYDIAADSGWDRELLVVKLLELNDRLQIEGLDASIMAFEAPEIDALIADLGQCRQFQRISLPLLPFGPSAV